MKKLGIFSIVVLILSVNCFAEITDSQKTSYALVQAKEAQAKIESLKAEIEELKKLKAEVDELKQRVSILEGQK